MDIIFSLKAFFVGFCAAAAFGPVFIMTFNRAALYGFVVGMATAFGAATSDVFFFSLAISGLLTRITTSHQALMALDIAGAIVLLLLARHYFYAQPTAGVERISVNGPRDLLRFWLKTVVMTLLNPSAIFFYIFVTLKLFSDVVGTLNFTQVIASALLVGLGSCTSLNLVSLVAAKVGGKLTVEQQKLFARITATILVGVALFLIYDATFHCLKLCR